MKEEKACSFWVKASPQALRSECLGWENNFLKIKIKALPTQGNANDELISFLALRLKISKSQIILKKGHTSRVKQIQVRGISLEEVKKLLL